MLVARGPVGKRREGAMPGAMGESDVCDNEGEAFGRQRVCVRWWVAVEMLARRSIEC